MSIANVTTVQPTRRFVERRDVIARERLVARVRCEFEEMPGLSLTLAQAARLFGLAEPVCARILRGLAADGALRLNPGGRWTLPGRP